MTYSFSTNSYVCKGYRMDFVNVSGFVQGANDKLTNNAQQRKRRRLYQCEERETYEK